jgi:hypothetical protein
MLAFVVILGVITPPPPGGDADVFPYFKPEVVTVVQVPIEDWEPVREYGAALPHPIATECPVNEQACLAQHDRDVLSLALSTASLTACEHSTHPADCEEVYRMIRGELLPPPRWPGMDDPCTLVVRVDRGVATLYNPTTTQTRLVPNVGWRAGAYVGSCDVASMKLKTTGSIEALPRFPWQSGPENR